MGSRRVQKHRYHKIEVRRDAADLEARVQRVLESGPQEHMHSAGAWEERLPGNVLRHHFGNFALRSLKDGRLMFLASTFLRATVEVPFS